MIYGFPNNLVNIKLVREYHKLFIVSLKKNYNSVYGIIEKQEVQLHTYV